MPARPRVRAHVARVLDRDGYAVENLWLETGRGLILGANLYRPAKPGRYPAVLHPHGHWEEGRVADDEDGSSQAFGIHLARGGYVALAYDMIGFNDTAQLPHDFHDRRAARFGVHLAGLQLWNSLRALDFLAAHPRVDASRIGIAGSSGGATQSMLLAAVDDRVAAAGLVCMISATMQGGCVCENAPGLRVGTDNVELSALMAPRPLLLVSATGDWTSRTPTAEYPAIRGVYRLYGREDRVANAHFDLPHNFLRESREAVYDFFERHLRGPHIRESAYRPEPARDLLARPPKRPLTAASLVGEARRRARPDPGAIIGVERPAEFVTGRDWIGRKGVGDRIPIRWVGEGEVTLVVHDGTPRWRGPGRALILDVFGVGRARGPDRRKRHDALAKEFWAMLRRWTASGSPRVRVAPEDYFDCYNATDDAERIQDIVTAICWARPRRVYARGRAAAWARVACMIAPVPEEDLRGAGTLDVPCAPLYA
jgi:hypothetical protein